jgi:hypothetical protein
VSHRPHYGFGGEGEGPIAGATGSATERNTPENTGMSDSGSDTTNNSGNGNDNGGGNGRDMREGNVFGPTEGDVPGMSAAALDYNRKVDAMQAENNSLFSSGAKDTATNPFLSGVRQMTSPQAQSDLTRLDSAINYPLIGGMIGNAYGVQQATPQQEAQIAGVINDMRTPQTVPANFGTPEGMLSRYGYPMGTTPQRAGSMGSMPTSYTTYGSNLNPVSSVGPRAGSMGSMPESSFQDASGNVPMPPERPSAMMDMSSSVGRATPAQQPQMNGVSSARSDFNRAFAEARSQGKQQFPWTNPFTGQQGMYRVAYNSGGRALYPSQIVEHVLNKISAPPPALDPMTVAKRGRP